MKTWILELAELAWEGNLKTEANTQRRFPMWAGVLLMVVGATVIGVPIGDLISLRPYRPGFELALIVFIILGISVLLAGISEIWREFGE